VHRALAEGRAVRERDTVMIVSSVAAVLLVAVGAAVIRHGLAAARSDRDAQRATDQAAVTDCLANVERLVDRHVIDLRDGMPAPGSVTVLRVDDALSA
jgi:hypothetical protein